MRRFATLTLGAALLAGATAWGDIHVAPTGDDSKTGENWAEALATIGAAVGRASAGDRILVSNGTYQVTSEVALTAGITIAGYGAREETIVSGPGAGSRVFRLAHADAVLENLTVTGGGVPAGDLKGAGVFLAAGTVRNCIIADNTPAVQYVYGVGLYMDGGVVSNCLIRGNRATMSSWSYSKGCGAHVAGGLLADSTLEENGLMTGNQGNQGGGLYLVDGVVSNCLIRANRVSSTNGRGAGVNMSGGQLLACRVVDNTIVNGSGAGGAGIDLTGGRVVNCLIASNWSLGELGGGGILMTGGTVAHSTIVANRAYVNGHVGTSWTHAGQGKAGAGIQWGYVNGAGNLNAGGGTVTNCIIYYNTRLGSQAQINLGGTGDYTNAIFFSCSRDLATGVNGNLAEEPRLVDWRNGDYTLRPDSPCIDAGVDLGLGADLAGQPRKRDGTGTGLAAVDMGAYERPAADGVFGAHFTVSESDGIGSLETVFTARVYGPDTNGLTYCWNFGNGTLAGGGYRTVSRAFTELGEYTVTLTVSNALGEVAAWTRPEPIRVGAPVAYVAADGGNIAPYDTWAKAATTIQAAVKAAVVTDSGATMVVVSNGTYNIASAADSILIDRGIRVVGLHGPANTIVWGTGSLSAAVYSGFDLDHPGAVVEGFTVGNFNTGVMLHRGVLRNSIIRNNSGATTRPNTEGRGNYSGVGGGLIMHGGLVEYCQIVSNSVSSTGCGGGGALITSGMMRNCTIAYNICPGGSYAKGGGIMLSDVYSQATLRNCLVMGNAMGTSQYTAGAGAMVLQGGRVENCTIVDNDVRQTDPKGIGRDGGIHWTRGTVVNSIIDGNTIFATQTNNVSAGLSSYSSSCAPELTAGVNGNISDPPQFVDRAGGNYRLAKGSPGLNQGVNLAWMDAAAVDLDNHPRVRTLRVDMGCYEYMPPPGSIILLR